MKLTAYRRAGGVMVIVANTGPVRSAPIDCLKTIGCRSTTTDSPQKPAPPNDQGDRCG